jgi:hypothetical protein
MWDWTLWVPVWKQGDQEKKKVMVGMVRSRDSVSVVALFFRGNGDGSWGFMHARQVLCHWGTPRPYEILDIPCCGKLMGFAGTAMWDLRQVGECAIEPRLKPERLIHGMISELVCLRCLLDIHMSKNLDMQSIVQGRSQGQRGLSNQMEQIQLESHFEDWALKHATIHRTVRHSVD